MFRLLFFYPVFLLSQEIFFLPDEASHLLDTLNVQLHNAQKEIYIFTPDLNAYGLINKLKQCAKKNVRITIITADPMQKNNKAAYLSLFKNIRVFTLHPLQNEENTQTQLAGSYICIDDKELFLLAGGLAVDQLQRNYSFAAHQEQKCKQVFLTLIQRAKAY